MLERNPLKIYTLFNSFKYLVSTSQKKLIKKVTCRVRYSQLMLFIHTSRDHYDCESGNSLKLLHLFSFVLSSHSFLHNEGQHVHSVNRIFVQTSILQTFTDKFIRVVQRLKIGNPSESSIQVRTYFLNLITAVTL